MRALWAVLLLLFFVGCANLSEISSNNDRFFKKYLENNETLQEMSFTQISTAYDMQNKIEPKFRQITGKAFIKVPFYSDFTLKNLGHYFYVGSGMNALLLNLDTKEPSSKMKIYEFGNGILNSVVYDSGDTALCLAIADKKPINLKIVSNFYIDDSEFFAVIATAKFDGEIKVQDVRHRIFASQKYAEKISAKSDEIRQVVVQESLQDSILLLDRLVCKEVK